jgi:hypothetical protein
MVGNDANLDILQLALHVTVTTEVSNILAKHLNWDKSPYRLHLPTITRAMEIISNYRSYLSTSILAPGETLPIEVNASNTMEVWVASY